MQITIDIDTDNFLDFNELRHDVQERVVDRLIDVLKYDTLSLQQQVANRMMEDESVQRLITIKKDQLRYMLQSEIDEFEENKNENQQQC